MWRRIDMENLIAFIAKAHVVDPGIVVTEINGTQNFVIELKISQLI
jgi:hypothetical protein